MMNGNGKDLLDITNNNQVVSKLNGGSGGGSNGGGNNGPALNGPTSCSTANTNGNGDEKPNGGSKPPKPNALTRSMSNNSSSNNNLNSNSDDVIVPYSSRALSYRPYCAYGSRSSIVAKKPCNHLTFKEENIQSYTDANGVLYKVSDYVYMDINKPNQPFAIASILDFKLVSCCCCFYFLFLIDCYNHNQQLTN